MLGRYEIVSVLGRGTMGTVYKALDTAIERTVAIKTLNPNLPAESLPEVKARFLREAKSAGQLNHPNVVVIYDVGEADGVAYIAMEYLAGQSLRQLLDSRTPLSFDHAAEIAAQIADALAYAHRHGIVHRDVKPANIMLLPSGLAKLTDFGVAYIPSSSMTQSGAMPGSPKYMSPEQLLGQPVDGRTDVFSLGVVLFEMLARRTPFEAPDITVFSLMERICTDTAPRVCELDPKVPASFDAILARALAKRPGERYQNAAEFAHDLRNWRLVAGKAGETTVTPGAIAENRVQAECAAPAPQPREEDPEERERMAKLLSDLDAFTARLEQQEREYAERQARAKAEAEAQARPAQQPPQQAQETAGTSRPKSALIRLLQEQAQAKQQWRAGLATLEQVLDLDARMNRAFEYLAEFIREMNAAEPTFAGELKLPFVGVLPPMVLGSGFVDYRRKHHRDKQIVDHVRLFYRMSSEERARVMLNPDEARILKAQLDRAEMKYQQREIAMPRQKVPHLALSIECNLPGRATLQADYDALAVEIRCRNVGAIGQYKLRIGAADFNVDAVEEFGKSLLGFPSRYDSLRQPDLAGP